MKKLIIFTILFGSAQVMPKDMSYCLNKKYFSSEKEGQLKNDYIQFHKKYRIEQEKASTKVLKEEANQIVNMINLQKCLMEEQYGESHSYKRGFHKKSHGCVETDVEFLGTGEGVFAQAAHFDGVVRFSNGQSTDQSDSTKDIRGLALKILNTGITPLHDTTGLADLDLLLINLENMPTANFAEFMEMTKLSHDGLLSWWEKANVLRKILFSGLANKISIALSNVEDIDYHSAVPYLYGKNTVVKYRVRNVPCDADNVTPSELKTSSKDFLSRNLKHRLEQGPLCFNLSVQKRSLKDPGLRLDQDNQRWSKHKFKTIAKLTLKNLMDQQKCENFKFNPWHTSIDHKPLGSVSRARSHIYDELSSYRQNKNSGNVN